MATVTREQLQTLQRLIDAVRRMVTRLDGEPDNQFRVRSWLHLLEPCEQIAAALASAPPAAPPEDAPVYPNSDKGLAQMCPGVPLPVLRGIQEAAFRAGREDALTAAQAPPESDPPGLVGVVGEFQRARANYRRAKHEDIGQEDAWARLKAARDAVLAYPLPASPQAETMPPIQVGDVVMIAAPGSSRDPFQRIASEERHAAYLSGEGADDVLAIYRDPLWRRPASPQAETTKGDE